MIVWIENRPVKDNELCLFWCFWTYALNVSYLETQFRFHISNLKRDFQKMVNFGLTTLYGLSRQYSFIWNWQCQISISETRLRIVSVVLRLYLTTLSVSQTILLVIFVLSISKSGTLSFCRWQALKLQDSPWIFRRGQKKGTVYRRRVQNWERHI